MSTTTLSAGESALNGALLDARPAPPSERPAAIVSLPSTRWLTRLELARPRRDLHSFAPAQRRLKRAVDVVGAIGLVLFSWPLMLLAALLVKLTSRGPVFYSQVRVGINLRKSRDRRRGAEARPPGGIERRSCRTDRRRADAFGRPFVLYKFRTMRRDAERNGARFAAANDCRVTGVGRLLRKSRIDELPQLWNVLKGEMSLVGPRPERPEFIADLSAGIPNYVERLGIKPGLTGLAQVENGYDNDLEGFRRKVAYDLLYLQNCCLWNDIKILFRTISVVLTGKGAL